MLTDLLEHGFDIRRLVLPRSAAPLHCMTVSAGYEQRRNEVYSWDGMKRGTAPFLVIQHTTLGEGRLDYAGVQHRLVPGTTMLVTMPHAHRYFLERGGHWEYFWLLLNGREALRLAREILDATGPVLNLESVQIDRLAGTTLKAMTATDPTPGQVSVLGYEVMTILHDGVFGTRSPDDTSLPAAIERVVAYIEGNLGASLHVERLAGVAEMSRAHFVRRFSTCVGQSPSDYVLSRRLARAERLLLATEMSVVEIAQMTGFANSNYFAKVFRKHRSAAPLEYRATRFEAR
ncbi:AraC family transcriptional regulator [uncultured Devosia sp.]|uniref:AraC family transcriptional regulator n=1 Tax=uncultured Devosia sp. TaxID=211434 RepID=UPI0026358D94|nr:AraC family transcriptional regulator [uncultured Devosia sp.]